MVRKQSILITGCSSGIGLVVAQDLQQLGYQVFATCRNPADVLKLQDMGLTSIQLDVTNTASINQALQKILELSNGKIDVLFNNAGFGIPGAVEDITKSAILEQFDTNVFGLLELTNKVLPLMRQQGYGKIIINSSILGFISLRYRGSYIASKHALEGLFDTLRLELIGTPISVSIIQPGPVTSKFRDNAYKYFLKHVNAEQSAHAKQYEIMRKRFIPENANGEHKKTLFELPESSVTKKILQIINTKHPRARYSVTFPTYLFRVLVRILPTSWLDKILYNMTKSETSERS